MDTESHNTDPHQSHPSSSSSFGHEGPDDRAQTSGPEGGFERARTIGHEGPNESAHTIGHGGPDDRAQTFGPERAEEGDEENSAAELLESLDDGVHRQAQVIAVGNQKGGVCKSTITVNLAAELGALGRRCLVIDLDANCGATRSLGVPTTWMGTFEALLGAEDADQLVLRNDPEEDIYLPMNVHLLPGNRRLEDFDAMFRERRENKFRDPSDSLKAPLETLSGLYDYIFLDTAPNASSPTIAAYKSAQWFVLSMTPDRLAYDALVDALTDILAVRDSGNPSLRLLGVVLSQVDKRTALATRYRDLIRADFDRVGQKGAFETTISRSVVVPKANEEGQVLRDYAPKHKVTRQYGNLAEEVEFRMRGLTQGDSSSERSRRTQGDGGGEPVVELTPATPQAAKRVESPAATSEDIANA